MGFRNFLEVTEEYDTFGDPKEWHIGQLALLDETGMHDFAVCKIVHFEDPPKGSDAFKFLDKNTIELYNPFGSMTYKRGESVPIRAIEAFGFHAKNAVENYNGFHFVGAQNLYRTIDALIKKEMKVIYPDLLIQYWMSPQYQKFIKSYPQMKEKESVLDQIEYQSFDVHGYSVIVLADVRAKKYESQMRQSGYPHPMHTYYFAIPELKVRSQQLNDWLKKEKIDNHWGLFTSMKVALSIAEKYIDYLFYSKV